MARRLLNKKMNVFWLAFSFARSVRYLMDPHAIKLIVEITQIVYTVLSLISKNAAATEWPYVTTSHKHHPIVRWAASSRERLEWVLQMGLAMTKEYHRRFGLVHKDGPRQHKCLPFLERAQLEIQKLSDPQWLPFCPKTDTTVPCASDGSLLPDFPLCVSGMPSELIDTSDPILTHRRYMVWKTLTVPFFKTPRWKAPAQRPRWWARIHKQVQSFYHPST